MRAVDVIVEKRSGKAHTGAAIEQFLASYLRDEVADYQMSAWLMAVFFKGMTSEETAALTRAMIASGRTYDWPATPRPVDKHSTGGVGDKVSLALAPLAAACGVPVPMVSGRGLGHTGGTLDKLEAIPGFRVRLSHEEVALQMAKLGVVMIGQSDDFVPADKRLYALRDVTGTVESIPLICASILSKKAASGARGLVMDVKVGSGAFMETLTDARALARGLIGVGNELGLSVTALLTDMGTPLGQAVGNANEVLEAVECLRGKGPEDLRNLTLELAAEMIMLSRTDSTVSREHVRTEVRRTLDSGKALTVFENMVEAQGGDIKAVLENRLEAAPDHLEFTASRSGFIGPMNVRAIGNAACVIGAGRLKTSDQVDHAVGMEILAKTGTHVVAGTPLVRIHHRAGRGLEDALHRLEAAIPIVDEAPTVLPLILERISS